MLVNPLPTRAPPLAYSPPMPRPTRNKPSSTGFGLRLTALRRARGLSQVDLAAALGVKQPTVSYYESQNGHPQADVLTKLAKVLAVSVDELLGQPGHRRALTTETPEARRLWKHFRVLLDLPDKDRRAVLHMLNGLAQVHSRPREHATA